MKKVLVFLLAVIILVGVASPLAMASTTEDEIEMQEAQILAAKGGANGIVSLTFDDGYYATALIIDELAKRYGLTASLMMMANSFRTDNYFPEGASVETWQSFFASSPLEPQSHTMNHMDFRNGKAQTEEDYYREFVEWQQTLKSYFPEYDFVTLAVPYGEMSAEAMNYAGRYYYALRSNQMSGVQSLDPGYTLDYGDWKNLRAETVRGTFANEQEQIDYIKRSIDECANGWYAPLIHRVGDHANAEMSYEVADAMFAYIAQLRNEGKVWVTTYSEATKYVRERQNAKAYYYTQAGKVFVKVTLNDYTEDGLALDTEVFDTPLTVKLEIPDSYKRVYYTVRGVEYQGEIVEEGGKRYTLVDVIPDGEAVALRAEYSHVPGEYVRYDEEYHQQICSDCGLVEYKSHSLDEGAVVTPADHMHEGVRAHVCTLCGEETESVIENTPEHNFNCKSTKSKYLVSIQSCTEGRKYYYSCECGEAGAETFYSTEPLGHDGEWVLINEATEDEDGLEWRRCTRCGTTEERTIPATGSSGGEDDTPNEPTAPTEPATPSNPSSGTDAGADSGTSDVNNADGPTNVSDGDGSSDNTVLIVAIAAGAAVAAAATVAVVLIIKKKRKG